MEICVSCKMATFSQAKTAHITSRLYEKRGRLQENMELRHKMLKASYHMQLQNDKNSVMPHIHHLQPGPRKVFLQTRLEKSTPKFK